MHKCGYGHIRKCIILVGTFLYHVIYSNFKGMKMKMPEKCMYILHVGDAYRNET
jgi:hypothetical protein